MTQIENRITVGNVLSMISTLLAVLSMVLGAIFWGGRQDQRMLQSERRIEQNATAIAASEVRIRSIEQSAARQDEKLLLILDSVREIKSAIKKDGLTP